MLHQLLEGLGASAHLRGPPQRSAAFALGMFVVDAFISHGPLKPLLLRLFSQDPTRKKEARRFLSQLAAKVIGMVFLAAIFPLAFEALGDGQLASGQRFLARTTTSQRMAEVGAGYFLYDIAICLLKYSDNGPEFLLHAVVCCSVFCLAAFKGLMHYYGASFLMWELSTPFMYIRWLMIKAGYGSSRAMTWINVAFMLVFFGCRNVWGPIMTLDFWRASGAELASATPVLPPAALWGVRIMALSLNLLNTYWLVQMVRIAVWGGKPKQKAV